MDLVPRHEFVTREFRDKAYDDCPLPIGGGQSISQPYMVAAMCVALKLAGDETVLDVGTGSGYQAAVLAQLAAHVYSIERDSELAAAARRLLARLGLADRVTVATGDGTLGIPQYAPYHGIVVGAGAPHVPQALVAQLRDGGRLVIPVGDRRSQELILVRMLNGKTVKTTINGCRFVPLVGAQGWPD